jgi:hypothetical protein
MKTYGGMKVYLHVYLTSALNESEWSASHSRYPLDSRTGGPQSLYKCGGKERNLGPYRELNSVIQPIA